ncbi:zinc-binding dehydrogenase [Allokutzneria sp. NRRL B-24872]|uniref:zinc-binding dehydrogenase n=1 Tax=Allokutzneria sp. NRRL B-24872 TaxID=1137961 RepID=UPI000A3D01E7|nr:alcohol dehydrogenase catalytic domain-containing protein [Allokutzneria sp. NRRL B-24872]
MQATVIYGPGDVRVEHVPDPKIIESTDAVVRVIRSCICGSDLWPYSGMDPAPEGRRIGHEFLGVVEETGSDVNGLRRGDLVVAPFVYSDNTCEFCVEGLHTSCLHGGNWGDEQVDGGQGEAVRVPQAAGTLVKLPAGADDAALLPSLLTLSDVFATGHHAAVKAGVNERTTVTVIGDGAVGLCAVLAAKRLGAEQIILMGRHEARTDLGRSFGATDVVAERGKEGTARIRELSGGRGTHTVLECVGTLPAFETAMRVVRAGGTVSRVGVPQYKDGPIGGLQFGRNVTVTGGVAPARHYIPELLPDIMEGRVEPGRVFDRMIGISAVPEGYRAMAAREALKVQILF